VIASSCKVFLGYIMLSRIEEWLPSIIRSAVSSKQVEVYGGKSTSMFFDVFTYYVQCLLHVLPESGKVALAWKKEVRN